MGFRFRKSIKVGRSGRVNLSRRGVGFSIGIPGTGIRCGHYPGERTKTTKPTKGQGCLSSIFGAFILLVLFVIVSFVILVIVASRYVEPSQGIDKPKYPNQTILPAQSAGKSEPSQVVAPPISKARDDSEDAGIQRDSKEKETSESERLMAEDDAKKKAKARVTVLLQLGKNYEKNKNKKAALDTYKKIVSEYPGMDGAKEAQARIEALSGK